VHAEAAARRRAPRLHLHAAQGQAVRSLQFLVSVATAGLRRVVVHAGKVPGGNIITC
jgi:hypothetical protein